jgi:hypothetical protein
MKKSWCNRHRWCRHAVTRHERKDGSRSRCCLANYDEIVGEPPKTKRQTTNHTCIRSSIPHRFILVWCNACSSHQQRRGWPSLVPLSHGETTISRGALLLNEWTALCRAGYCHSSAYPCLFIHTRTSACHSRTRHLIFATVSASNLMAEVSQPHARKASLSGRSINYLPIRSACDLIHFSNAVVSSEFYLLLRQTHRADFFFAKTGRIENIVSTQ